MRESTEGGKKSYYEDFAAEFIALSPVRDNVFAVVKETCGKDKGRLRAVPCHLIKMRED